MSSAICFNLDQSKILVMGQTAGYCFSDAYVGKYLFGFKRILCRVLVKRTREGMDRWTGCHNINEMMMKML